MPLNFPEIWVRRVRQNLNTAAVAPYLDGIPEMDAPVTELGAGSASEANIIHVPTSSFSPEVLINNTTYPIALQSYNDSEVTIQLDKYQTKVTTLTDDQVIGAAYDRIDAATRTHVQAINAAKYAKAIHALAPDADTVNTPVILTSGTAVNGRKALTYADIVALKAKFDGMGAPEEGRRLVLCSDHQNDLLLDRDRFGDKINDLNTGKPAPVIAGFEIYTYARNPLFSQAKTKLAYGAVGGATDTRASVAFVASNVAKLTGLTKQYFSAAAINPENQINKVNYRHYFIAVPFEKKYIGAIASTQS